ncbi:MAG: energy transducer TonB [Smithella sp.]
MREELFERAEAGKIKLLSKTAALSVIGHVVILFLLFFVSSMPVSIRKDLGRLPIIQATLVNVEKISSLPQQSMSATKNKVNAEERKDVIKPQVMQKVTEQKIATSSLSMPSVQDEKKGDSSAAMSIDAKTVKTSSTAPGTDKSRNAGTGGGSKGISAVPKYRSNPHPPYPFQARVRGHEGLVILTVDVREDGRVSGIKLKRSSGYTALDQSALATVRSWLFEPARRSGIAVASVVEIPVRFSLQDESND